MYVRAFAWHLHVCSFCMPLWNMERSERPIRAEWLRRKNGAEWQSKKGEAAAHQSRSVHVASQHLCVHTQLSHTHTHSLSCHPQLHSGTHWACSTATEKSLHQLYNSFYCQHESDLSISRRDLKRYWKMKTGTDARFRKKYTVQLNVTCCDQQKMWDIQKEKGIKMKMEYLLNKRRIMQFEDLKNVSRASFHPGHEATTFVYLIISYITGGLSQATWLSQIVLQLCWKFP